MSKTYLIKSLLLLFALAPLDRMHDEPHGRIWRHLSQRDVYALRIHPEPRRDDPVPGSTPTGGELVYDRHNQHRFFVVQLNGP